MQGLLVSPQAYWVMLHLETKFWSDEKFRSWWGFSMAGSAARTHFLHFPKLRSRQWCSTVNGLWDGESTLFAYIQIRLPPRVECNGALHYGPPCVTKFWFSGPGHNVELNKVHSPLLPHRQTASLPKAKHVEQPNVVIWHLGLRMLTPERALGMMTIASDIG